MSKRLLLSIDGQVGPLNSVQGGYVTGEVVRERPGPGPFVKKHLATIRYEDVVITAGFALPGAFYDWISATWDGHWPSRAVSIIETAPGDSEERQYLDARIVETIVPALDGSAGDAGYLTVRIAPERVLVADPSGGAVRDHSKQSGKRWHVSDFRLEIDGLDCTNVRRIDSFAVRSAPTADDTGDHREPQKQPGVLDFPDLSITIARTSARSWLDWHDDFVVKGNNGQAREKSGSLVLLSRKKKCEVARVDLFNLGVYRVAPDRSGDVTARLYCERMEFRAEARPR